MTPSPGFHRQVRSLAVVGALASALLAIDLAGCASSPASGVKDSGAGNGGGAGGGSGGSSGGCGSAVPFVEGDTFRTGTRVTYMGKIYVAKQDNPGYYPNTNPFFWELDPACNTASASGDAGGSGDAGDAGTTDGAGGTGGVPDGPGGLEVVMTEALFDQMFPARAAFYTYQGLVDASRAFPMFAGTGDMTMRKQEAAAFLANVAHETGNLVKIEEDNRAVYCQETFNCACEPNKSYYGRGPLQLTWNYNYCLAGLQLGLNLRADPDLAARDAKVAYQTALWFWMTQMGAGSMTPHAAIVEGHGFGETIRALNGANECAGKNPGQVQSRVTSYTTFVGLLGVAAGDNTGC